MGWDGVVHKEDTNTSCERDTGSQRKTRKGRSSIRAVKYRECNHLAAVSVCAVVSVCFRVCPCVHARARTCICARGHVCQHQQWSHTGNRCPEMTAACPPMPQCALTHPMCGLPGCL